MKIIKKVLSKQEIIDQNISSWPIWEKEKSQFDWFYDSTEHCLILEGKVFVKTATEEVEINAGDFVTFPKGLACNWRIVENIRKHYKFE